MDRSQGVLDAPPDELGATGRRSPSKLAWILAGWILLSALAVVGALMLNRSPTRSASNSTTDPGFGSNALPGAGGTGSAGDAQGAAVQGDARLPVAAKPAVGQPADGSQNWSVHLIYTAVEKYYRGTRERVTGCPTSTCTASRVSLGSFPVTFVSAVRAEGSGLISTGRHAGHYLDYDATVGYWLDTAARGYGSPPMKGFATARSTSPLLPIGTQLRISVCGPSSRHDAIRVCGKLRSARWQVVTEGAPSPARDIWLYIGRESGSGTGGRPWVSNFQHATLRIG